MPLDLEGLGKSISETIALRKIVDGITNNVADTNAQIDRNKKEISRIKSLIQETDALEKSLISLGEELSQNKKELDTRIEKLKKAGINLPLNEPSGIKGFMVL